MRREDEIQRAIIIGFHYEDVDKRREEFHPQGTRSHKTVQVVGKELLPFIDKTFPTYKVGNARILMGDSLAGSIALLTALTYPTIFSQVAMLSPHSDETVIDKFNKCIHSELSIWRYWFRRRRFCFANNWRTCKLLTPNRDLATVIKDKGLTYHYLEFEGGHNWKSWKPLLSDILKYYLSDELITQESMRFNYLYFNR